MGFFNRVSTIFKANVNAALDEAEDPEKMLNQITNDLQEQLVKVKQQVAAAIAQEKRLQKDYENEQEQADSWEQKATIALQREKEDLAREALTRRNEHANIAAGYKEQWEKQRQAVTMLKDNLRTLERKIDEAGRKKNLLIARQKRAKAQKAIHETMAGMKDNSAFATFDRMEQKVGDMEARADAASEMSELSRDPLEEEFAALETGNVDDDLAALKAKMGGGQSKTDTAAEAANDDLAALKSKVESQSNIESNESAESESKDRVDAGPDAERAKPGEEADSDYEFYGKIRKTKG